MFNKGNKKGTESQHEWLQVTLRANFCARAKLTDEFGFHIKNDSKIRIVLLKPETKSSYTKYPNNKITFDLYRAPGDVYWKDEYPYQADLLFIYTNKKQKVAERTLTKCTVDSSDGTVLFDVEDLADEKCFGGVVILSATFANGVQWSHAFPKEERAVIAENVKMRTNSFEL